MSIYPGFIYLIWFWMPLQNNRDWAAYQHKEFILPSSGDCKSKISMPAGWDSPENALPDWRLLIYCILLTPLHWGIGFQHRILEGCKHSFRNSIYLPTYLFSSIYFLSIYFLFDVRLSGFKAYSHCLLTVCLYGSDLISLCFYLFIVEYKTNNHFSP